MAQQTYDPAKVSVTLANNTLTQFAKGTFVKVSMEADAFTDEAGARGEVVRVRNNDERGTVEVTLMKASPSNDILSALADTDRLSGQGVGALLVRDASGTSIHSAENAWVKKKADAEYGTEENTVTWTIRCDKLKGVVGGTNA